MKIDKVLSAITLSKIGAGLAHDECNRDLPKVLLFTVILALLDRYKRLRVSLKLLFQYFLYLNITVGITWYEFQNSPSIKDMHDILVSAYLFFILPEAGISATLMLSTLIVSEIPCTESSQLSIMQ